MGMSGFDLRKFQYDGVEEAEVKKIFGKMISGKDGYETVLDKNKPVLKCGCGTVVEDCKFCPECGEKVCSEQVEDKDKSE